MSKPAATTRDNLLMCNCCRCERTLLGNSNRAIAVADSYYHSRMKPERVARWVPTRVRGHRVPVCAACVNERRGK